MWYSLISKAVVGTGLNVRFSTTGNFRQLTWWESWLESSCACARASLFLTITTFAYLFAKNLKQRLWDGDNSTPVCQCALIFVSERVWSSEQCMSCPRPFTIHPSRLTRFYTLSSRLTIVGHILPTVGFSWAWSFIFSHSAVFNLHWRVFPSIEVCLVYSSSVKCESTQEFQTEGVLEKSVLTVSVQQIIIMSDKHKARTSYDGVKMKKKTLFRCKYYYVSIMMV